MSKAEDRRKEILQAALDYANNLDDIKPTDEFSMNLCISLGQAFMRGAEWADEHQAEKDLELTWEDMREIYCITLNLRDHVGSSVFGQPFYEEVLKRFKDLKK